MGRDPASTVSMAGTVGYHTAGSEELLAPE